MRSRSPPPDTIAVRPRGGILICEDGSGQGVDGERIFGARLVGIDARGDSFVFAENDMLIDRPIAGKPLIP